MTTPSPPREAGGAESDPKKRILRLIERYGTARAQKESAGFRGDLGAMKRNYDIGNARWSEIEAELDALLTAMREVGSDLCENFVGEDAEERHGIRKHGLRLLRVAGPQTGGAQAMTPPAEPSGDSGGMGAYRRESPQGPARVPGPPPAQGVPAMTARFEKLITYCGQPAKVACDGNCGKAWGVNNRPSVQLSDDDDDTAWLADHELGDAPADPGTYEGGHAKPAAAAGPGDLNKWCVRECERCVMSEPGKSGEPLALRDFTRRVYNKPSSDPENRS